MIASLLLVWHALSLPALLFGAGGVALLVVVALGLVTLPGWLTRPMLVAGGVMLAGAALYQTAYARATVAAELRAVEASAAAERKRAEIAEAINRDQAAQLERDRAEIAAGSLRLQELAKAVEASSARDRACVPRDLARQLRKL